MSNAELAAKVKEYRQIQQFIKQLEDEADTLKAAITAEMEAQEAETVQAGLFTVKWTPYTAQRLDAAALKNELPDIAARYTKSTEIRRFQVA
jgi:predicted phage-related endonuclease